MRALSVQGGITGYGYDIIIIDDPMKASAASSETERRKLEETYASSIANRWRDPSKGVLIVVMQRLHIDDFSAYLLRTHKGFVHLNIPAIAPSDMEFEIGPDEKYIFKKGEFMEPHRLTPDYLAEMRVIHGKTHFDAQYLGEERVHARDMCPRQIKSWLGESG